MKHDHHSCEHVLKMCKECDVAYCSKCRKEWNSGCKLNHYPNYWYAGSSTFKYDYAPSIPSVWMSDTVIDENRTTTVIAQPEMEYTYSHVHE